ncbi:Invasin [compost metagenome]
MERKNTPEAFSGRPGLFRLMTWTQIILQLLFPLLTSIPLTARANDSGSVPASPFSVDRDASASETAVAPPYADTLTSVATALSSGEEGGMNAARSTATGFAGASAQSWLSQFGTARVQLNVDDDGNWDNSSVDFLAPLYDNQKSVLFTQLGMRAPDGRFTGNFGMGVRTFYLNDWMFGGNIFLDDDFTGKNRRIGLGGEAWTNYLKLSANTYLGTTDWHSSRDFDDYNEKPADGFDLRAEGYLPAYPQLGAKIMYEKYHGDQVALFDTDHLQKNPSAITTGLSYTPVPLVSLGMDYKQGQDSLQETQFQLNIRYEFGRSLAYQFDPDSVRVERSLAGSRYDLVERNNTIVMQYQKKALQSVSKLNLDLVVDNSPADGLTPNTAQVHAVDRDGAPVSHAAISWTASGTAKLITQDSVTDDNGNATASFTNANAQVVQIQASNGQVTAVKDSRFDAVAVDNVSLKMTKDNNPADGVSADTAIATVMDSNNHPIANAQLTWHIDTPATISHSDTATNAQGQASVQFTSHTAASVSLTTTVGGKSASTTGHFVSTADNNVIDSLSVTTDNSPANGVSANKAVAVVKDSSGAPVAGVNVNFSADKSTVVFGVANSRSSAQQQTDAQGRVSIAFTDTTPETVNISATLENGNSKSAVAHFAVDTSSITLQALSVTKDGSLSDGSDTNAAEVYVKDKNGAPVANISVGWSADKTTVGFGTQAATDANGKATIKYTDTVAENIQLTARLDNGDSLSIGSTFVPDTASAKIATLTTTTGAVANGAATNQATVTVVDANNNPLPDTDVTWRVDGSAQLTSGSTGKTGADGTLQVTFTDLTAQTVNITATLASGSTKSATSTFVPDTASAKIATLTTTTGAVANGAATNQATVTVVDANNNPLPDTDVTWRVDGSAQLTSGSTGKTGADGTLQVAFTDTTVEPVNITATLGNGVSQTSISNFVIDITSSMVVSMVVDNQVSDGIQQDIAKVVVTDSTGHRIPNKTVAWSLTGSGSAQIATSTPKTDSNGEATVNVTAYNVSAPSTVTITATADGVSGNTIASFTAKSFPTTVNLEVVKDYAKSDGNDTDQVEATVLDQYGDPMSGVVVEWQPSSTTRIVGSPSRTTDSNGKSTVGFTSTYGGGTTIKASVNGTTPTSSVKLNYK